MDAILRISQLNNDNLHQYLHGFSLHMSNLRYPANLGDHDKNPASIHFQFFERDDIKSSFPGDSIQLYMPQGVAMPGTTSWSHESFGFLGASAVDVIRGEADFKQAASQAADKAMSTAGYGLGSAALQMVGGKPNADLLMGAIGKKLPNPYMQMIFRGVDFRSFAFTFKFVPFSESDCNTIHEIIKALRKNSLPDGGDAGADAAFLGYPNECEIQYRWKGSENPWIHKFKRAVCTGVDVDYTGQGMFAVMRNGFPANINVTTKWTEVEIVLRRDVDLNY